MPSPNLVSGRPRSPTDAVLPARFFDDSPAVKVVMRWMVRVDDVLDANKLHISLVKLIELPSWRRLGGRLRLNVSLSSRDSGY